MFIRRLAAPAVALAYLTACGPQPASATPAASPTIPPAVTAAFATLTPAATLALTDTPPPTPEPGCTNDLAFLTDVTVPDGQHFIPGQPVDKQWSVQNSGTCDWGPDYRLVLTGGDSLSAPSELALYPARAGTTLTLQIQMKAPGSPGSYVGRWQARDPNGSLFGSVVFIKIEVVPSAP